MWTEVAILCMFFVSVVNRAYKYRESVKACATFSVAMSPLVFRDFPQAHLSDKLKVGMPASSFAKIFSAAVAQTS